MFSPACSSIRHITHTVIILSVIVNQIGVLLYMTTSTIYKILNSFIALVPLYLLAVPDLAPSLLNVFSGLKRQVGVQGEPGLWGRKVGKWWLGSGIKSCLPRSRIAIHAPHSHRWGQARQERWSCALSAAMGHILMPSRSSIPTNTAI